MEVFSSFKVNVLVSRPAPFCLLIHPHSDQHRYYSGCRQKKNSDQLSAHYLTSAKQPKDNAREYLANTVQDLPAKASDISEFIDSKPEL